MQNVQKKEVRHFLSPSKSLLNLERKMQTIQRCIKDLEKFKQIKDLEVEFRSSLRNSSKSRHRYRSYFNYHPIKKRSNYRISFYLILKF